MKKMSKAFKLPVVSSGEFIYNKGEEHDYCIGSFDTPKQTKLAALAINNVNSLYKALHDMCYAYRHKHGLDGAYDTVLLQAEAALKEATQR